MSIVRRIALVSGCLMAGCVVGELDEDQLSGVDQAATHCPPWACGGTTNSPEVDHMGIHDIPTQTGLVTENGFSLVSIERLGAPVKLRIERSDVVVTPLVGPKLIGAAALPVDIVVKRAAQQYTIRIAAGQRTIANFWGRPNGAIYQTPTFRVVWWTGLPANQHEERNICTTPPLTSDDPSGMPATNAVLFESDRISARFKTVGVPDLNWFNIGCYGHALMKLHLAGYTESAMTISAGAVNPADRFFTKSAHRQAFLKMITGDYCGTGDPFTVAGQPLNYSDNHAPPWLALPMPIGKLEARWTEKGAACLNTPRIDANPTPDGIATFGGNVVAEIAAVCRIPQCKTTNPLTAYTEHVTSVNP